MQATLNHYGIIAQATSIPADVTDWTGGSQLMALLYEAVDETHSLVPLRPIGSESRCPAKMLLTLLTFAYATGVYSSQRIESRIKRCPTMRYLTANAQPDWNTLRRFRRANRELIEHCLAKLFTKAWTAHSAAQPANADSDYAHFSLNRWHQHRPMPAFQQEVSRRLQEAILADTIALDC